MQRGAYSSFVDDDDDDDDDDDNDDDDDDNISIKNANNRTGPTKNSINQPTAIMPTSAL